MNSEIDENFIREARKSWQEVGPQVVRQHRNLDHLPEYPPAETRAEYAIRHIGEGYDDPERVKEIGEMADKVIAENGYDAVKSALEKVL